MNENDRIATYYRTALANFEGITGREASDSEKRSMRNKIAWRVSTMPLPKGEVQLHKGFGILNNKAAEWWREASHKMHTRLLKHESGIEDPFVRGAHTFHIDNDPKLDYSKDTDVVAVWDGKQYVDPTDGVPVSFTGFTHHINQTGDLVLGQGI